MISLALDGITGFSISPLRLASVIGALTGAIAMLLFLYTFVSYLFLDVVHGWPSLMGVILLFGSVQMFFLGIIGEYLGRLFIQSKHRPLYVMREIRRHEMVTDAVASGDVETTSRIIPEAQPEVEVP
jgi:dolichol-phosphate mannosyltransferase